MSECPSCHADVPPATLWPCRHMTPNASVTTPTVLCDDCRYAVHIALLLTPISGDHAEHIRQDIRLYEERKALMTAGRHSS